MSFFKRFAYISFFFSFFIFAVMPVFAAGNQEEDRLKTAEKLIEEQKYNQAIELIEQEIRDNPERFDEGEALMERIRNIRSDYNVLYQELIDVLYVEKDVKKALDIIAEMEKMDSDPNPATRELIAKAKETARFVYNQEEFLRIMNQAASYIADKRYMEAVSLYRSGFDLYKEEFFASAYADEIKDKMSVALDRLDALIDEIQESYEELDSAYQSFYVKLQEEKAGEYKVAESDYNEFSSVLSVFVDKLRAVKNIGNYIYSTNIFVINSYNLDREDFFLGFMQRYVNGRVNVDVKDGISGALEQYVKSYLFNIVFSMSELVDSYFAVATGDDRDAAAAAIKEINRIGSVLLKMQKDMGGIYVVNNNVIEKGTADDIKQIWPHVLKSLAAVKSVALLDDVYALDDIAIASDAGEKELAGYIDLISSQYVSVENLASTLKSYRDKLAARYSELIAGSALDIYKKAETVLNKKSSNLIALAVESNERISSIYADDAEKDYDSIVSLMDTARAFIDGKEEKITVSDKEETVLAKYPDKAIDTISEIRKTQDELVNKISRYKDFLLAQESSFIDSETVDKNIKRLDSLLSSLDNIEPNINRMEEDAKTAIFNADRYRNEAERKLAEAERAINLKNYEEARNLLEDAGDLFSTSLSYKEDKNLRASADRRLLALSDAIVKAENQRVIVEVRRLIDRGRELYLRGSFDEAERTLLRAKAQWAITQPEENPEVEYWLKFVKAALSIQRGRTVADTDPLYTDITQLLNLARADYKEAKSLLNQGKREEALRLLDKASENLLRVRMAFPLNQDASLLFLRIEQLKNPEGFDSLFKEKMDEAVRQLDESPQEAYAALKDLREINPNFPGLANAIYQAEIKLGIRIPPPDPAKIARAKELYTSALSIYNRNDRANFAIALEQLNQAVLLDPDNRDAITLKDRLQLAMGGQTSVVLPSYALKLYKEAEQKFTEGSFYEALAIVRKLMEDKRAKNYPPLIELKKRIESRI